MFVLMNPGDGDGLNAALGAIHMDPGCAANWRAVAVAAGARAALVSDGGTRTELLTCANTLGTAAAAVAAGTNDSNATATAAAAAGEAGQMHVKALLQKAREASAGGDTSAAISGYKALLTAAPTLAAAWAELSAVYEAAGKGGAAEAALMCGVRACGGSDGGDSTTADGGVAGDDGDGSQDTGCMALELQLAVLRRRRGELEAAAASAGAACASTAKGAAAPAAAEFVRSVIALDLGNDKQGRAGLERAAKGTAAGRLPDQLLRRFMSSAGAPTAAA